MSKPHRSVRRAAAAQRGRTSGVVAPGHGRAAPRRALLIGALAIAGASGIGALALARPSGGNVGERGAAAPPVLLDLDADTVSFEHEEVDLGHVPLEKVVPVSARLTNHSRRKVILSQATAQTLEGC